MGLRNITPDEMRREANRERWRKLALIDLYKSGPYAGAGEMEREAIEPVVISAKDAVQGVETVSDAQKEPKEG